MAHILKTVVLVVEDDPIQRLMAVSVAEDAGYEAIEATNAKEAVRILESRNDIRIVFTDIDMPGSMDGMKLAACVRDRWPPVEIILTSGHFSAEDVKLPARGLFFSKPYNPDAVSEAMRRMASLNGGLTVPIAHQSPRGDFISSSRSRP
jgi:CheY-like chemotaxis protein